MSNCNLQSVSGEPCVTHRPSGLGSTGATDSTQASSTGALPAEFYFVLCRFTSGPKSSVRSPSDDGSLDSPSSASGGQPTSPHWAPLDSGASSSPRQQSCALHVMIIAGGLCCLILALYFGWHKFQMLDWAATLSIVRV